MEVKAVWFGGETSVQGTTLSVRTVLDELNRRHPAAKYGRARNEKGELLKPSVELTNNQVVLLIQNPS
jgi:hypothetical protein